MNIFDEIVSFLISEGFGTVLGTDIFIGGAPLGGPNECYWIIAGGGSPIVKNVSGEKQKTYIVNVFYRSTNAHDVYNQMQLLEELFNRKICIELDGYNVLEAEASQMPTDDDLDEDDRTVGFIQATITIYE